MHTLTLPDQQGHRGVKVNYLCVQKTQLCMTFLYRYGVLILCGLALWGCSSTRTTAQQERFGDNAGRNRGQTAEFTHFNPEVLKNEDHEYVQNIRSVKLYRQDVELSMPVLEMGSEIKLQLIFDDLDGVYREYRYTLVHCDPFWNPTGLSVTDYIEGFSEGLIEGYAFSQATRQPYVHYHTLIPGPDMRILRSGNYLLKVYDAGAPDQVIITRRMMVYESRVKVNASVKRSSIIEDQRYKQEIDFEIDRGNWQIDNPYNDLVVHIQQNGRWDNAVMDIKPRLVTGSKLNYDWDRINAFDGTNEFRHVDLRTIARYTPRVGMIQVINDTNHVFVMPDFKRAFQVYIEDKDLNGDYVISSEEALSNHYTEADYAMVHFTFPVQSPFDQGAIYLFGALTNWQFLPEYRMSYNAGKKTYEVSLFLKQGYYNYHYVMLENTSARANTFLTEGDHFETENFYTIYVYHRMAGDDYHRLIAVERVISPRPR